VGLIDWLASAFVVEAAPSAATTGTTVTRRGYEYAVPDSGLNEFSPSVQAADRDRRTLMAELYDAYLACPWSWASTNAIARRITAGGLEFVWDPAEETDPDAERPKKPAEVVACERLFRFVNDRENIRQLLRGVITDLLVFGDAFVEVVWRGQVPVGLFSLDCPSITPTADAHGQITGYVQLTEYGQRAEFEPHEVIHISLDSPRSGVLGISPTQAALVPIQRWLFAAATLMQTYRKGDPLTLHVDLPAEMSGADVRRWVAQHMARNVGPGSAGYPVITKGGGQVHELGARRIESAHSELDKARDEILATYGVPPAKAGVIESGNLGGGTDEGQDKTFDVQTCDPISALVLEAFFYRLAVRGFGVSGWKLQFTEVDTRDSKKIEEIRELRFKNGAYTLNEWRAEIGKPPVEGGDQALVLVAQGSVMRVRDIDSATLASLAKQVAGSGWEVADRADPDEPIMLVRAPEEDPAPDGDVDGWDDETDLDEDPDDDGLGWDEDDLADEERDDLDDDELSESVLEAKVRTAAGAKKYGKPIGSTITKADRQAARARRRQARADRKDQRRARRAARKARNAEWKRVRRLQSAPVKAQPVTDVERERVTAAAKKFAPVKLDNFEQTNAWLDKQPKPKGTEEQIESLYHYTANGYSTINEQLRKGVVDNEIIGEDVRNIDALMTPASHDLRVVRTLNLDGFPPGVARSPGSLAGKVLSDRGYMSTTLGESRFGDDEDLAATEVFMDIAVPKGTPSIYARRVSHYPNEGEIILPRGQKLLVTDVKKHRAGSWIVSAVVVPSSAASTRSAPRPAGGEVAA